MRGRPKKVALKNRKSGASSLKLCSLPPTSDVFNKCTQRINASCGTEGSNSRVTAKYGPNKVIMVGSLTTSVFCCHEQCHLVDCQHHQKYCNSSGAAVQTAACSCSKLGCTVFCVCGGRQACDNPLTQLSSVLEASDMATHETHEN